MRQYEYNPYGWTPPNVQGRSGEFSHQAYARQAEDEERARLAEQEGIWIPEGSFTQSTTQTQAPPSGTPTNARGKAVSSADALADPYSSLYEWTEETPERQAQMVVEVGTAEGIPEGPQKPLGFPLRRRVLNQDAVNAAGVNRSSHKPLDQFAREQELKTESAMALQRAKADYNNEKTQQSFQGKMDSERRRFKQDMLIQAMRSEMENSRGTDAPAIRAKYEEEFRKLEDELYGSPQSGSGAGIGLTQPTAQQNLQNASQMYPPAQPSELQVEVGKTGKKTASGLEIFQDNSGEYVVINGKKTYRKKQQ